MNKAAKSTLCSLLPQISAFSCKINLKKTKKKLILFTVKFHYIILVSVSTKIRLSLTIM